MELTGCIERGWIISGGLIGRKVRHYLCWLDRWTGWTIIERFCSLSSAVLRREIQARCSTWLCGIFFYQRRLGLAFCSDDRCCIGDKCGYFDLCSIRYGRCKGRILRLIEGCIRIALDRRAERLLHNGPINGDFHFIIVRTCGPSSLSFLWQQERTSSRQNWFNRSRVTSDDRRKISTRQRPARRWT